MFHLRGTFFEKPQLIEGVTDFEKFGLFQTGHFLISLLSHRTHPYLSAFGHTSPSPQKCGISQLRRGYFGKKIPKSINIVVEPSFFPHFFRQLMRFQEWYGLSPNSSAFILHPNKRPTENANYKIFILRGKKIEIHV